MPHPKKKTPDVEPSAVPPSKTTRLFAPRKAKGNPVITHERIAADLEAFRKAGGKIEVLGVTRTLSRIDADDTASPPPRPAGTAQSKSRH